MSLAKGDHLVIKRNGVIVDPEAEAYHEFEVTCEDAPTGYPSIKYAEPTEEDQRPYYLVGRLRIVR